MRALLADAGFELARADLGFACLGDRDERRPFRPEDLDAGSRNIYRALDDRRGYVGEPLRDFWLDGRLAGVVPANVRLIERRHTAGSVPSFVLDDMLYQIERRSLLDMLAIAHECGCRGFVSVMDIGPWGGAGDLRGIDAAAVAGALGLDEAALRSQIEDRWGSRSGPASVWGYRLIAVRFTSPGALEAFFHAWQLSRRSW